MNTLGIVLSLSFSSSDPSPSAPPPHSSSVKPLHPAPRTPHAPHTASTVFRTAAIQFRAQPQLPHQYGHPEPRSRVADPDLRIASAMNRTCRSVVEHYVPSRLGRRQERKCHNPCGAPLLKLMASHGDHVRSPGESLGSAAVRHRHVLLSRLCEESATGQDGDLLLGYFSADGPTEGPSLASTT
jgi:hypothetical protein